MEKRNILIIKQPGAENIRVRVTNATADMINDPGVDPNIKQIIIDGLVHDHNNNKESVSTETAVQPTEPMSPPSSTRSHSQSPPQPMSQSMSPPSSRSPSPVEEKSVFKVWKDSEEKCLIDLRHKMEKEFATNRNHLSLWLKIAEDMFKTLNFKVTAQQCNYKYNALKKKWKEIIDAPSGSATKHFVHRDSFDEFYGTRNTTKPKYAIDTDAKKDQEFAENEDVDDLHNEHKCHDKEGKASKGKKRKRADLNKLIEEQHNDFIEKMTKMHEEKMNRFDKFLTLMEKNMSQN